MIGKAIYGTSPLLFLAMAAQPIPDHWQFVFYSFLGSFAGACARVGINLYAGTVDSKYKSMFLTFASFWLGMIGALVCYLAKLLDGTDPIKIMGYAAICALFGVLLEMLGARWIKARAQKEIEKQREVNQ